MAYYKATGKFGCQRALDFLRATLKGLEAMIEDLQVTAEKIQDQPLRLGGVRFLIHTSRTIKGIILSMITVTRRL